MEKKLKNVFIICGKARNGKEQVASILETILPNSVSLSMTKTLKDYAKLISDWDGSEETKPRTLLQTLGIEVIKKQINPSLLIHRILEDIEVLSYYKENILITGVRLKEEIDAIKNSFPNTYSIQVVRPNFDNQLTTKEKAHITENDLDDYTPDYQIINDGNLKDLEEKVRKIGDIYA